MEREQEEDLPPGFSSCRRRTRSSSENHSSLSTGFSRDKGKRNKVIPSNEEPFNTPNIKFKFRGEDLNSMRELSKKTTTSEPGNGISSNIVTSMSELSENYKTSYEKVIKSEPIVVNASDKGTILGDTCDEVVANTLSFHGENGTVYTLSDPPKATLVATPLVDAPSIICVKRGLVSFLTEVSPNDIGHMLTQANNIFAFLQGTNAEYKSFYSKVRSYICHCSELYVANKDPEKCKESEKLVAHYDRLLCQSEEIINDVLVVEDNIEKAKGYMAPLEARVRDMKELLEKLEFELEERKNELGNFEAIRAKKMEETAVLDVEIKASAADAEKTRKLIRENIARRVTARIRMEKARNQLRII